MRIKILSLVLGVLAFSMSACADNNVTTYAQLPAQVQTFMGKYFGGVKVKTIKADTDDRVPDFDIILADGTKVEIDTNGDWSEISNRTSAVPVAMLPDTTQNYIKTQYPNNKVMKIEKDRKGYDVKLDNGTELEFDTAGNFVRIDR